jgi:predicted Zn-dependent peptidase
VHLKLPVHRAPHWLAAAVPLAIAAASLVTQRPALGSDPPPPRPTAASLDLQLEVEELELKNGMRFLLIERRQSPTVACMILVGVGSADEPRGRTGMAHFLEHLLFKGTSKLGTADYSAEKPTLLAIERTMDAIDAERNRLARETSGGTSGGTSGSTSPELERLNAELARLEAEMRRHVIKNEIWGIYNRHGAGSQNAFTSEDLTAYFVVLPANKLEVWARVESERMMGSVLREFYSERSVVQEERRRSRETTPQGMANEALMATAYVSHPYHNPVIGWMSDLEHLRRDDVLDFYRTFYQPSNMVGVLVGDFDRNEAEDLIQRHFGRLESNRVVRPRRPVEPPMNGMRERIVEFDAEPELRLAFRVPVMSHPDFPAIDVLASILGGARTSRLRKRLLLEEQAVRAVGASLARNLDPWLFEIHVQPLAGRTIKEVESMVWEEIHRLARAPATAEELGAARTRMRADTVYLLESNFSLGLWLGRHELMDGDWSEGYRHLRRVEKVTPDEVMRVAATYLTPRNEVRVELKRPSPAGGELP